MKVKLYAVSQEALATMNSERLNVDKTFLLVSYNKQKKKNKTSLALSEGKNSIKHFNQCENSGMKGEN